MNKDLLFVFAVLAILLVLPATDAQILRPNVILKTPQTGDNLKGDVNLVAEVAYPDNATGEKVDTSNIVFEYRNQFCAGQGTCVRGMIASDADGTDGWSTIWDTTAAPDGDYFITVYLFGGGQNGVLLNWYKTGFMHVNQSTASSITGAIVVENKTINETNITQSAENQTSNQTVSQNQTQFKTPEQTIQESQKAYEQGVQQSTEAKKKGFWGAFFQWVKDIFS